MTISGNLQGKRIFITGGSRGIGLAIALRAAADGASVAIAAKTADPNPKLPGTIFTAAKEMGLVAEISEDSYTTALTIAKQIAAQPPTAIINTKALIKASKHDAVAAVMKAEFELFALALTSDEAMEAFMNFMAKKAADKEKGGK